MIDKFVFIYCNYLLQAIKSYESGTTNEELRFSKGDYLAIQKLNDGNWGYGCIH